MSIFDGIKRLFGGGANGNGAGPSQAGGGSERGEMISCEELKNL